MLSTVPVLAMLTLPAAAARAEDHVDPGWPNVLIAFVLVVLIGAIVVSVVLYRRARETLPNPRRRRQ